MIPAFLFVVFLNSSSLSELARRDSAPYLLLVFLFPAVLGLVVEGATQMALRRCRLGQAVLCVLRNLATGLAGLAIACLLLFGTSWFDSWQGGAVLIFVICLLAAAVLGIGGLVNSQSRQGPFGGPGLRAYITNAGSVLISGVFGALLGLGSKAVFDAVTSRGGLGGI